MESKNQHIVIVGGGFGGITVAKQLKKADADVTIIDRSNHHLFQPLLYQVATAALSPGDVAAPIRAIIGKDSNVRVLLGEVQEVHPKEDALSLADGRTIRYDKLVLAPGAKYNYFGHASLFGVYGMLGIGLMLFVLKGLATRNIWKENVLGFAFWAMNIGLALMVVLSILPEGLAQTVASVKYGLWYARSAEFTQYSILDTIRWLRVIGDTIFAVGAFALVYFVAGLKFGWSVEDEIDITKENYPQVQA